MNLSKHNIIGKMTDSDNFYIVNPLSKNADILSPEEGDKVMSNNIDSLSYRDEFIEKGYLVDSKTEDIFYKTEYLRFIEMRDTSEIQIFFVPTYACNFSCSYCFQSDYVNDTENSDAKIIESFFSYIDTAFAGKKKYLTIFGGEPLLPGDKYRKQVELFLKLAKERNLDTAIVTNGYTVVSYMELFKSSKIREIQLTLDGTSAIHNSRRMLKGGGETFQQISEGIDKLLANHIAVNLRMVVDKSNLENLSDLAQYAIDKGWTNNQLFKTQLGRNYELHYCQKEQNKLYSRIELYEDIYKLILKHPHILQFHKPAFSISKFLFENGELPEPLFDSCPGCKTEWAFDYTGKIYSCTATVGKIEEMLGTFYPTVSLKTDLIEEWQERDVLSITKCKDCNLRLACGGGCASVAKNESGKISSPDCRPVKELLSHGLSLYFEKIN